MKKMIYIMIVTIVAELIYIGCLWNYVSEDEDCFDDVLYAGKQTIVLDNQKPVKVTAVECDGFLYVPVDETLNKLGFNVESVEYPGKLEDGRHGKDLYVRTPEYIKEWKKPVSEKVAICAARGIFGFIKDDMEVMEISAEDILCVDKGKYYTLSHPAFNFEVTITKDGKIKK